MTAGRLGVVPKRPQIDGTARGESLPSGSHAV